MTRDSRLASMTGVRAGAVAAVLVTSVAAAQQREHPHAALGTVHFAISCTDTAQRQFDRGIALLHHMTYPRARETFEAVSRTDSTCAMAHWGIAMTLFQPLWPTRPGPADLARGWSSVQRGLALAPPTERERALLEAAGAFFLSPESSDYWARVRRWESAMRDVQARFPDDPEIAAFTALAILATAPLDAANRSHAERAAELLLDVYAGNPEHPGAMHYLVHANDATGRERLSLDVTRKYESVAPGNPHALHMPTHIYTRLGDWPAVVRGNLRAADAALEFPVGTKQLVWDEFPHAVEYLVYAYLQQGADREALAQARRLMATPRLEPSFKTAYHLASIPARYVLERRAWREAAALTPREAKGIEWDRFGWPEAISWFARGLGAARLGDAAAARQALERIGTLEQSTASAGEELFARQIGILRLELAAWTEQAEGRADSAVSLMRRAAELEAVTPKHAVMPAPTLPALELLGDLLAVQGDSAAALDAYRRSLDLYPLRFATLLGAARMAAATGDRTKAREYYTSLLAIASRDSERPGIAEARRFLKDR